MAVEFWQNFCIQIIYIYAPEKPLDHDTKENINKTSVQSVNNQILLESFLVVDANLAFTWLECRETLIKIRGL